MFRIVDHNWKCNYLRDMPQIFIIPEEILNKWHKIVQYEPCNNELLHYKYL